MLSRRSLERQNWCSSSAHCIHILMVQLTLGSGLVQSDMDMAFKSGQMAPNMRDSGNTMKLQARASLNTSKMVCMTDNGRILRRMGMVYTIILTARSMSGSGKMTSSTGKACRAGLMATSLKGNTALDARLEQEISLGVVVRSMKASSWTITLMGLESTAGKMEGCMRVSGKRTRCTEKASIHGPMAAHTWVSIEATRRAVMGGSNGQMEASMKVSGRMGNSTARELSSLLLARNLHAGG
mmetsp:Transcript_92351/g.146002  ORF Transcript_92351/g.146002 Transcript_92351/m.146002 type:complete len:240 (-) Transcript_92351:7-726(-)